MGEASQRVGHRGSENSSRIVSAAGVKVYLTGGPALQADQAERRQRQHQIIEMVDGRRHSLDAAVLLSVDFSSRVCSS